MQNNRLIGYLFIALGALVICGTLAWGGANMASDTLQITGFLLLLVPAAIIAAMLVGSGAIVIRRSGVEARQYDEVGRQRRLLSALQTQGQLTLAQAALETGSSLDQIKQDLYDLVGKGLFSGYINWDSGILYARQARDLRDRGVCPNCGGQLQLAGKGVIRCPYCGTEIFL